MSSFLYGLHDRQAAPHVPDGGWIVDTIALSENPAPQVYDQRINTIVRANWGYGSTGTIPTPDKYPQFAAACASWAARSKGVEWYIISNEPNGEWERPNGVVITAEQYARCFVLCRNAIKQAQSSAKVMPAAMAPYHAAPTDWLVYLQEVLTRIGQNGGCDAVNIHAYSRSMNPDDIASGAKMGAPLQDQFSGFFTYLDALSAVPVTLRHVPAFITEFNVLPEWKNENTGVIQAMYAEINRWNARPDTQKILGALCFRWLGPPEVENAFDWEMRNKSQLLEDFRLAVVKGHESPQVTLKAPDKPKETNLPSISTGTLTQPALPERQIDERLTARGVTIETPPLAPGQQFWRIVKAQWWNEQEAQGRHHIYIEAPDRTAWRVVWPSGSHPGYANGKSGFDASNYPMSKSLNEFSVQVRGDMDIVSETLKGIGMGDKGNSGVHTSTGVVFQLVAMPAVAPTPPPIVSPGPQPVPQPQPPVKPVEPAPSMPTGIIEPRVAQAILKVESGGRTHGEDGRIIIRFEAHIFKTYLKNDALWAEHFSANAQRPWMNQQWRADPNGAWLPIHTGKQADEWAAFEFANNQLSTPASFMAISMGAPQIMGFNFARIGYPSAADMYAAFRDPLVQTIGFINFFLSDPSLADAMRRKDWRTVAAKYNGTGQIDLYAGLLEKAYKELGG